MWLHSFLPTAAFQHDHHHTEKWSMMKLLFGYRQFHLYRLCFLSADFTRPLVRWKMVGLNWADSADWVIFRMTIYFDPWPFTIAPDVKKLPIWLKTVNFYSIVHVGPDLKWQAFLCSWKGLLFVFALQQRRVQGWLSHDERF